MFAHKEIKPASLTPQPSNRPDWSRLVTSLHSLHARTLPGVYLNLSLPSIPTPPSSPETENNNGEEEEQQANSPQYNNVRRGNGSFSQYGQGRSNIAVSAGKIVWEWEVFRLFIY